ncbi:MFS general substrate transporter [Artomyces pyxidatus]|uniref:MFS general substrate transporter n=1 Tax=Artomyces pyxidatus TaxID=48021 RepID=A0ACB8SJZ1_9AGAM|nr:MFS general substrate transporter [Artomyces pyxidatus]
MASSKEAVLQASGRERSVSDLEKPPRSLADSTDGSSLVYDYDSPEDRKLLRKIDLRLIPIVTLLYLLSFLDRSNIGNAKIDGLTKDLHVSPPAYNTALALFFLSNLVFEVPANVSSSLFESWDALKRLNPQIWLPTLTFAWGIASVGQGLITNQPGLFGIRILLGATEAGLFPGVIYVFSVYYRRRERHWRVAIFFGGAALAGAFGGILAYAIGKMEGVGGKRGWQWIFILEGLLTIVISWAAYFLVPTWSHNAKFLTSEERSRLLARLAPDSDSGKKERFAWVCVRQAIADPLVWGYAFLFHGFAFALFSLSVFLPTIIADLGFATWKAQLMTVPPNVLAALGIAFGAWLAARTGKRAPLIIGAAGVAIVEVYVLNVRTAGAQYAGVHFAALGVYTGNALLLSWPSENISGQTKRAIGVAMQITIGDLGSATGLLLYRPAFADNHFRKPHIIAIGYLTFAILVTASLWYWMASENQRRAEIIAAGKDEEVDYETKVLLGDREVHWKYQV